MTITPETDALLRHLATRPGHDEVKAGFRDLLVREFGVALGAVDFERRDVEIRGRLDALVGRTVFEAKSDLGTEWADVARRMPDYLGSRERETGEPFIGIASDGARWVVLELRDGGLSEIKATTLDAAQLDSGRGEAFLAWLDGALALQTSLFPDALTIRAELGQESIAWHFVRDGMAKAWDAVRDRPAEALKRQLWADLLKQVYGREIESDALWFQHSYLVVIAKCIALAVMQLPEDDPRRMLSGEAFSAAGIDGAVESDFFDWIVASEAGAALVRRVMAHVRRFRLAEVESDVLKILYESLIDRDERHGLGEYYTPDWLAAKVVRHAVERPLEQKVLDPGCGSGTFLFHAVRGVLAEAEDAGVDAATRAHEATLLVAGTDIHPVAVIIARVTYLLALAPALATRGGPLSIPVFLGDAMQLSISQVMTGRELVIRVPPPPAGEGKSGTLDERGREQLDFPETVCRDPQLFDKMIERMRTGSLQEMDRAAMEAALTRVAEQHYLRPTTDELDLAIRDLGRTYVTFDRLRREGRDTIWSYVARNFSRPLFFSSAGGWANVLVGNPPWVAYRHMSADLQKRFRELARGERVHVGGKFATQNDLCALFSVRASHLYLRAAGRLALVLPLAALTRGQFEKFRAGRFASYNIAWDEAWTMDDSVVPLFPVPSCVVFGRKRAIGKAIPDRVRAYRGSLPLRDAPEAIADARLTVAEDVPAPQEGVFTGGSQYRDKFRQGAVLVPRMLSLVERRTLGRIGANPQAPAIVSRRSAQEKEPWKSQQAVSGQVESRFLRPVLLGESIVPYLIFRPFEGVVPFDDQYGVLSATRANELEKDDDVNSNFADISKWMQQAEGIWLENRSTSSDISLIEQFDYYGKLASQFPIAPLRIVYAKAGSQPAACLIRDTRAVIDHKLYWAATDDEDEAYYLVAILNSETARARAERYQSRGQFGARDFDKVMFNLPIARYDAKVRLHRDLAAAGREAELAAQSAELKEGEKFQRARKRVRDALVGEGIAGRIDRLVARLLDRRSAGRSGD